MTTDNDQVDKAMLTCDQCGATSPGKPGDTCPKCGKGKLMAKAAKDAQGTDNAQDGTSTDADVEKAGKLEAGLKSIADKATAIMAQVKGGKLTPQVVASLAGLASDAKALAGQYPSPKVAREFADADAFNAWVEEETAAILTESDPLMKALRTQSLGESVAEFRKASVRSIEDQEAGKIKIKVYMDPMRGAEEPTPHKTVKTPGTPGKPKGVMKGEGDPEDTADNSDSQDGGDPPAGEDVSKGDGDGAGAFADPVDDGAWPLDMGADPTSIAKGDVDVVNRRPGAICDDNVAQPPAQPADADASTDSK